MRQSQGLVVHPLLPQREPVIVMKIAARMTHPPAALMGAVHPVHPLLPQL